MTSNGLWVGIVSYCLATLSLFSLFNEANSDMRIFTREDFTKSHGRHKRESSMEMDYLIKYGYAAPSGLTSPDGEVQGQIGLREAILNLQKFLGLPQTGIFDDKTKAMMRRPRCANTDKVTSGSRSKRYAVMGSGWPKSKITYSINNFTPKVGKENTHEAIDKAFGVWATYAPLRFTKVSKDQNPDIVIFFAKGYHDDNTAFDGEGGFLAHAYYPGPGIGGDTHFDSDEPWTVKKGPYEGNDLFLVAVHELGHALGLAHTPDTSAIMAPIYQYHDTEHFQLPQDDIDGIRHLYGRFAAPTAPPIPTLPTKKYTRPPRRTTTTTRRYRPRPRPTTSTPYTTRLKTSWPKRPQTKQPGEPDLCSIEHFDAVSYLRNEFYVFSNEYMWRKGSRDTKMKGPFKIGGLWPAMQKGVDVVYEKPRGIIVMIKDNMYYEFLGTSVVDGYPQRLRDLGLNNEDFDAGVWWKRYHKTYLFKGHRYWRMENSRADWGFPKEMDIWKDIPGDLDAAFMGVGKSGDNETYFVKGNKYWKFHSRKLQVLEAHDSFKEDFLGCDRVVKSPATGGHSNIPTGAIAAIVAVAILISVALTVCIYRRKFSGYKYTNQRSIPRDPPPPYSRGYESHFENGDSPEERYLWVKSINHGWNNIKYSLQHKV